MKLFSKALSSFNQRCFSLFSTGTGIPGQDGFDRHSHPNIIQQICPLPLCKEKFCGKVPCANVIEEKKIGNHTNKEPSRLDSSVIHDSKTKTALIIGSEADSKSYSPGFFQEDPFNSSVSQGHGHEIENITK